MNVNKYKLPNNVFFSSDVIVRVFVPVRVEIESKYARNDLKLARDW